MRSGALQLPADKRTLKRLDLSALGVILLVRFHVEVLPPSLLRDPSPRPRSRPPGPPAASPLWHRES